jgi:hypothetical protein
MNREVEEMENFYNFPNPGMIAYAQYTHSINLKESIYITDKQNCSMTKSFGFYYLDISMMLGLLEKNDVFERIKIVLEIQQFHPLLEDVEFLPSTSDKVKRFPLIEEFLNSTEENSFENDDEFRIHGVLCQRKTLEKYNEENDFCELFEEYSALEISKKFPNYEPSQQEMDLIGGYISPEPAENDSDESDEENKSLIQEEEGEEEMEEKDQRPTISMSIDEIMDYFGMVYFQRGRDYSNENRVSNVGFKMNSNSFKLTSTCQGTREKPYKQQVTLKFIKTQKGIFKNGKLVKSKCSCPMGDEGICKHACAMVLSYLKSEKEPSEHNLVPSAFSEIHPLNDWCIKARIVKKNPIRTWENENSSGSVASVNLVDHFDGKTEINAVFFNDAVKIYETIKKGKIYLIARAHVTENKYGTKNINIVPTSIVKLWKKRDLDEEEQFSENKKSKNGEIEFKPYLVESSELNSPDNTQMENDETIQEANEVKLDETNIEMMIDEIHKDDDYSNQYIDELGDLMTPVIQNQIHFSPEKETIPKQEMTEVIPTQFTEPKTQISKEKKEKNVSDDDFLIIIDSDSEDEPRPKVTETPPKHPSSLEQIFFPKKKESPPVKMETLNTPQKVSLKDILKNIKK